MTLEDEFRSNDLFHARFLGSHNVLLHQLEAMVVYRTSFSRLCSHSVGLLEIETEEDGRSSTFQMTALVLFFFLLEVDRCCISSGCMRALKCSVMQAGPLLLLVPKATWQPGFQAVRLQGALFPVL